MVNQEEIYQLLYKKDWKQILGILHQHKDAIAEDSMLTQSARVFETEFIRNLDSVSLDDKVVEECLDGLYVLNHMKYIKLTEENFKSLVLALVRRKSTKEAAQYAKLFPEEEISKAAISKWITESTTSEGSRDTGVDTNNHRWVSVYNRFFELINNDRDAATYFSGPRFIKTIQEFDSDFLDYHQYIQMRNLRGQSTTRKIYFFDILKELAPSIRESVLKRILHIVKPSSEYRAQEIESALYRSADNSLQQTTVVANNTAKRKVFISYSWDSETHKDWVLNLAKRLREHGGVDVILDRFYLRPGVSVPYFVETSIRDADKVLIIFTPNYKQKADGRTSGVGYEYSIVNVQLYQNQTSNGKIIPILRAGSIEESIPTFMQQFIHLDVSQDENFENSYNDLLREIYDQPIVDIPSIGEQPSFLSTNTYVTQAESPSESSAHGQLNVYIDALDELMNILVPNQTGFDLEYIENNIRTAGATYQKFQNSRSKIWAEWESIVLSGNSAETKKAFFSRFLNSFYFQSSRFTRDYTESTFEEAKSKQVLYKTTELKSIIYGTRNSLLTDRLELDRFLKLYKINVEVIN